MSRHMLAHDLPPGRFTMRAAAVILREGFLLVGRVSTESIWYLPGGRVEWGESTLDAVRRELLEEVGVAGDVGPLALLLENFFLHEGVRFHEIAYYYPVSLPEAFPFRTDGAVCHRGYDGDVELEFRWLRLDARELRAQAFRPIALGDELARSDPEFRHLVFFESGWRADDE